MSRTIATIDVHGYHSKKPIIGLIKTAIKSNPEIVRYPNRANRSVAREVSGRTTSSGVLLEIKRPYRIADFAIINHIIDLDVSQI